MQQLIMAMSHSSACGGWEQVTDPSVILSTTEELDKTPPLKRREKHRYLFSWISTETH